MNPFRSPVPTASVPTPRPPFGTFYREVFGPEHRHPLNRALHIGGTLAGLAWVAWLLTWPPGPAWLALLLFPVVHAGPGLIGHRLVERSAQVGDARWRRTDFPGAWFILANHRMTAEWLLAPLRAVRRRPGAPDPGA